ncbi:hypothetical protein [Natronorarus salvus]|uniref:hypothetical protein n=1 Tax=Natronorarus salvus TaxID=3117733 RepID=UPI002F262F3C
MIDWEATATGLRVSDRGSVTLEVVSPDWTAASPQRQRTFPRPADVTVTGRTTRLSVLGPLAATSCYGGTDRFPVDHHSHHALPPKPYLLDVDAPIPTAVRFEGAATVSAPGEALSLSFDEPRHVTLGFRGVRDRPDATITVAPTVEGLACALSHLHCRIETSRPAKSLPALRGHPPRVVLGERTEVPESVESTTHDTGIELHVPGDVGTLYTLAPLAYYLQARVRVAPVGEPTIRSTDGRIDHPLGPADELESAVASLLARLVHLDGLVRSIDPFPGTDLDGLDLDPRSVRRLSPVARLETYLSVPEGGVEPAEWPVSSYLPPEVERVEALSHLLDRMSLVHSPRVGPLDSKELLQRSLTDFFRRQSEVASVDVVTPMLGAGRSHAWFGEEIPIDVFHASTDAFENALSIDRADDRLSFVVVGNDPEMAAEVAEAVEIYESQADRLPVEVTVHDALTREELARVFERPSTFVHYIGHCEREGLRCSDGHLPLSTLSESNAETFFLNACGSFEEGRWLIERGSIAGGVTFSAVLNEQAVTVGTTFARLLVYGFSIDQAMQLARRRIMMGKNYAVVGDGTHALTGSTGETGVLHVDPLGDGSYAVTYEPAISTAVGTAVDSSSFRLPSADLSESGLEWTTGRAGLLSTLSATSLPVIHDGTFRWPADLVGEISDRI